MEDEEKKGDINNNDFLLYYTKYKPYDLVNSNNNDNNNESIELNEDENDNNNILNGRWSQKEHLLFIKGCLLYGNYWKKVKKYIQTRSCSQIRSHAQKYLNKLNKKYYGNKNNVNNDYDFNLKLNDDEIKRLVNKNKFSEKDMDDAELYILSIFKGNKDKEKIIDEQEENENIYIKNKRNDCEKIFNITKVSKEEKEKEKIKMKIIDKEEESNKINNDISENDNINECNDNNENMNINNNNINDNNNMDYLEDNIEEDKKSLKENIPMDKEDMNLLLQKEVFINKCLDSKDPKDLVKLLTFFDNDINFKVNDLKILKKYQDYLGLDIDNSEDNNNENNKDNNSKDKDINETIYPITDNSINNQNQNMYPYLFNPSNNTIQFNPLYNPKLIINPAYMNHY